MDVFGSRDDDPLLRNDPLAPLGPKEDDPGTSGGTERSGGARPSRLVEYSAEEAATGPLRTLNRAFGQGWRLKRVERKRSRLIFTLRRDDEPPAGRPSV